MDDGHPRHGSGTAERVKQAKTLFSLMLFSNELEVPLDHGERRGYGTTVRYGLFIYVLFISFVCMSI